MTMSKMAEIAFDIENMLMQGYKPCVIADMLKIPIQWVEDAEEQVMQLGNPYFYGPDAE